MVNTYPKCQYRGGKGHLVGCDRESSVFNPQDGLHYCLLHAQVLPWHQALEIVQPLTSQSLSGNVPPSLGIIAALE